MRILSEDGFSNFFCKNLLNCGDVCLNGLDSRYVIGNCVPERTVISDPDMLHFSKFGIHMFHLYYLKVDILGIPKLVLFFSGMNIDGVIRLQS